MMAHAKKPLPDDAPHLLVVDDDARIRDLLSRYLSDHGFRVTTAGNAAEARAKRGGLAFDLLVLDIMMPGENGLDLARSIRADSQVPILMLTARAETNDRISGLETGVDDYLTKPFDPRELLLRINGILRRAATPQPLAIETVRFGDFTFHIESGELLRDDKPVRRDGRAPTAGGARRRRRRARRRRADQPAAPQDRGKPHRSALSAHGARRRLPARRVAMMRS